MTANINRLISTIFLTALICGLNACNSKNKQREKEVEDQMFKEVMAIHDEVMPKTGDLYTTRIELEKELNKFDSSSQNYREIKAGIRSLEIAEESMMDWMRGYEVDQEGWPHDSVMSYLGKERVKILEVRELINTSLQFANQLLGQSVQ